MSALNEHRSVPKPEIAQSEIVSASSRQLDAVRSLWLEYWDSLALPPEFQNFDEEQSTLPGVYAPPTGRLLLALVQGAPAGTVALRRLSEYACEAKRL